MEYSISTDKTKLDVALIHEYLSNQSYWARGRSREKVQQSIDHSICFGVYDQQGNTVGFARAATDTVVFAYLMDVFILEPHRGKGLGERLVKTVLDHPDLQVKFWFLGTVDAHGLYKKLGFTELKNIERYMEKKDPTRL